MFRSFVLTALLSAGVANAQWPSADGVAVGQEICVYGYIMDFFCVNQGFLLDAPDIKPLENPEMHSLHCLLDVPQCTESPFHVLEPTPDGETPYGTGWQAQSNDLLLSVGREQGSEALGCTTCPGDGELKMGFRASVSGKVVTVDPPVLDITSVEAIDGDEVGCTADTSDASVAAVSDAAAGPSGGQWPSSDGVAVGEEVCVYGYVMDFFCVNQGFLLDAQDIKPLENPELHSLHCLLDVPQCTESPFHILEPTPDGETPYGTGWQAQSNDLLLSVGREQGSEALGCTTCPGDGELKMGFRASVVGTVVTVDPPVLDITSVEAIDGDEVGCTADAMDDPDASAPAPAPADPAPAPADSAAFGVSTFAGLVVALGGALFM